MKAMLISIMTTEGELIEFLTGKFGHFCDDSADKLSKNSVYLNRERKGRPRRTDRFDVYGDIHHRNSEKTVDDIIEASLDCADLDELEAVKRGAYRHKNRTHPLLEDNKIYNIEDFFQTILAKDFYTAAAIFITSTEKTKTKIINKLKQY